MVKFKSKKEITVHAIELCDQKREKELVELWDKYKNNDQSVKIKTKSGETFEIKFKDIDFLIFDNSNLISSDEIFKDIPDCPLI